MYLPHPGHIDLEAKGRREKGAENKEIFWNSGVKVKLKQ